MIDLHCILYPSYYLPDISSPYFEKWIYIVLKFLIENHESETSQWLITKEIALAMCLAFCVTSGNIFHLPQLQFSELNVCYISYNYFSFK